MSIHFTQEQWDRLEKHYRLWRRGELGRPVVPIALNSKDPGRPRPGAPLLSQASCAELSIPADALIDRIDWELSRYDFLGDAFPWVNLDSFGPGILSAMLGAELDNSTGRVWFHPREIREIGDLHLSFDPDNIWYRRIGDIIRAGLDKWGDRVIMGMPDLGGILDILSTFRPGEKLLLDLYDHPDEVIRLTEEIHALWLAAYGGFMDILEGRVRGYSDWSSLYQDEPGYIVQCDFSYMISPDMFGRFAKGDLERSFRELPRNFYHLDGVGELCHLDALLSVPELNGIQWIPGDGQPDPSHWPDIYDRIASADKLIQLTGSLETFEKTVLATDFAERFHLQQSYVTDKETDAEAVKKILENLGL